MLEVRRMITFQLKHSFHIIHHLFLETTLIVAVKLRQHINKSWRRITSSNNCFYVLAVHPADANWSSGPADFLNITFPPLWCLAILANGIIYPWAMRGFLRMQWYITYVIKRSVCSESWAPCSSCPLYCQVHTCGISSVVATSLCQSIPPYLSYPTSFAYCL